MLAFLFMDIDISMNIRLNLYLRKVKSGQKQTMLLYFFLGLFQKRREINECREQMQDYSVSFRSNLMCGTSSHH